MSSIYPINKGINKPIEFKGLKAQYIGYLGAGLLVLLILFAILYIAGVNSFICIAITIAGATALFVYVYKLSRQYGQYGMMKAVAKRSMPQVIKSYSRRPFIDLSKSIGKTFHQKRVSPIKGTRINKSLL